MELDDVLKAADVRIMRRLILFLVVVVSFCLFLNGCLCYYYFWLGIDLLRLLGLLLILSRLLLDDLVVFGTFD